MINIEDNFNYLKITDITNRLNPRIAMYPKKSTTFDIIFNNVENTFGSELDGNTRTNFDLDDGSDLNSNDTTKASDGDITTAESGDRETSDFIASEGTPISGIANIDDNRNIYIRRGSGGILLSAKLFSEMNILIGGRSTPIDDVIVFLSENTSI